MSCQTTKDLEYLRKLDFTPPQNAAPNKSSQATQNPTHGHQPTNTQSRPTAHMPQQPQHDKDPRHERVKRKNHEILRISRLWAKHFFR